MTLSRSPNDALLLPAAPETRFGVVGAGNPQENRPRRVRIERERRKKNRLTGASDLCIVRVERRLDAVVQQQIHVSQLKYTCNQLTIQQSKHFLLVNQRLVREF